MIYRVILKVSYNEVFFDFDDIVSAGAFARIILTNMVDSEDVRRKSSVRIEVINTAIKEEEED